VLRLTASARDALRSHEVLRAVPRARLAGVAGRRFRPVDCDPPNSVLVHEQAFPHLAGRAVVVDCRSRLGIRHFVTDLPADFGLRASLGRLPGNPPTGGDA
jgi:hypothetical protein